MRKLDSELVTREPAPACGSAAEISTTGPQAPRD